MTAGGAVDVATEEVVDGDIPFAGEFKPVAGIPPVSKVSEQASKFEGCTYQSA